MSVSGAGGFIGAYFVRKLLDLNCKIRAIDNFSRGNPERLRSINNPNLTIYKADVRQRSELLPVFDNCIAVFHLAAINGTENFYKHPDLVLDVCVREMLAIANASLKAKVSSLIVASSAEVYQTPKTLEKVQVFRPHNVYGPDMGWKHVIPQLIKKIEKSGTGNERTISIQGDGSQTRAFCYVGYIVDGIITMWLKGDSMNIYHIGSMQEISIKELAEQIAKIYHVRLALKSSDPNKGETSRRCPDISKIAALGYTPKVSLEDGLRKTVEWYKLHPNVAGNNLL